MRRAIAALLVALAIPALTACGTLAGAAIGAGAGMIYDITR